MKIKTTMRFLALSALTVLLSATAAAETVGIFYRQDIPQHEFAAGDIKAALESKGFDVEIRDLSSLKGKYRNRKIIISLTSDKRTLSMMSRQGGLPVPEQGPQAYAVRTTGSPFSYWVFGGDENGAMYGGLQIAEDICFGNFGTKCDVEESPFLKNRGVKFNIPLDKDSPTYFYSNDGTANRLAIKDVWDMGFWKTWFDEMARHRYNVLSLWSPHPFTSMLDMEDEYPGIAIQGVTGYDIDGNETRVNGMSIGEKTRYWQEVMKYGKERGFDIYFCAWNIFLSTADGKHGLTHEPDNEKTKEYLRKCMYRFLETYPDLKGFGITVGERMGSLDYKGKEKWAWETYGKGMMEYAQAHPERDLVFIHRQHDGNIDHILEHFARLDSLPNVKFDLSCKYSEAHAHATTTPARWHNTGMERGLGKYRIMSWLTIRNDDFYFLHWAEPQFVRDYVKGFPEPDRYVTGFYIGADGWVPCRDFTSINPYYKDRDALSIQRTWYMQKLWGRLSYNPDLGDGYFREHLSIRFPEVPADKLFDAWSYASGAVRKANEQVTGKWKFDNDFWIEMWTGDTWAGGRNRHFTVEDTKEATPSAGSRLASLYETATGNCQGKISAWENIADIEKSALHALEILRSMDAGKDTELSLTLKDIEAQALLALYSASKFKAVIYDIKGDMAAAGKAMEDACRHWIGYTEIMAGLYYPVRMQRNKSFSSWHDYDDDVKADCRATTE